MIKMIMVLKHKPSHGKGSTGKIGDCPEIFHFHIKRA
jgi:hypothetical protein